MVERTASASPEKAAWSPVAGTAEIPALPERLGNRRNADDVIRGKQIVWDLTDQEKSSGSA